MNISKLGFYFHSSLLDVTKPYSLEREKKPVSASTNIVNESKSLYFLYNTKENVLID